MRPGIFAITLFLLAGTLSAQTQTAAPQPCSDIRQKQMDFWLGDWVLTWPGNKAGEVAHGKNMVKRIMDGCVVQENFSGEDSSPLRGTSVSLFDLNSGKWKQTWVDNEGSYLDFVGEFNAKDGQMILARESAKPDGTKSMQRMVFKNISHDEFDWSWEASSDEGKTWTVQWPIHYKRQ